MTAEIVILNRSAIVLAADSAATHGKRRVWKSTNKLFSVSPLNSISVMVYGLSEFQTVPWETIIKLFREKIGDKVFQSVEEARDSFFEFLQRFSNVNDSNNIIMQYAVIAEILSDIKDDMKWEKSLEFRNELKKQIKSYSDLIEQQDSCFEEVKLQDQSKDFRKEVGEIAEDIFKEKITKGLLDEILKIANKFYASCIPSDYETGVVFAGFGKDEIFPVLYPSMVDGTVNGKVRFWHRKSPIRVSEEGTGGMIVSFAQTDVAHLFMEEVSQSNLDFLEAYVARMLNEKSTDITDRYVHDEPERQVEKHMQMEEDKKIVKAFRDQFKSFRAATSSNVIMEVVGSLPKEEMALMAQALVELTSLKRKLDSNLESVAGPVDVAIITRGDGLIWKERKHYFDIELNRDFLYRKRQMIEGGSNG